jgi:hypothetical protein
LFAVAVPPVSTLIPFYSLFTDLGLTGTERLGKENIKGMSVASQIRSSQEMSCNSLFSGGPTRKLENLTFRPERSGVQHIGPTA